MIEEVHLQRMPRILSLLAICLGSVPAQSTDCAQLNNLFNIADLKTLTSGPFVPKPKEASTVAPAKVVLKGVERSRIAPDLQLAMDLQPGDSARPSVSPSPELSPQCSALRLPSDRPRCHRSDAPSRWQ